MNVDTYDALGNRTNVKDPRNNNTAYAYDNLRRMITMTQPIQTITQFSQKSDARGTEVSYTYDSLNRITLAQFTDSTQNVTYSYDSTSVTNGKGRLTGRTDSSGSYIFSYDVRGNLSQEDKTINSSFYTTQYAYNKDNVLISITYPTGRAITYTPDVTGNITNVSTTLNGNQVNLASSITYYPYGGVGGLTYGNGLSLSHVYDNQYRTSSITVGSILNRTYGYDDNSNVNSITDTYMSSNGQGVEQARGYIYETGRNLLNDVWGGLSVVYDYDENGNTITENNRTYIYDLSNRLIAVQDNSTTIAQYVYNALNQRVKKILSGGTTIFHYDLQGHLIAETDTTGVMLGEYVYLRDELLAMIRPGQVQVAYYYHNDHLGTPQILTDGSGTIVWRATYKPYGEAVISIETIENPFRFPGQYYDQETGLHYNWNRYYDPKTGRYLTPDPIGLERGVNLFTYVSSNPIAYYDSNGLLTVCRLVSIGKKRVSYYTNTGPTKSGYPVEHGCIAVDMDVYKIEWLNWTENNIKRNGGCIWNEFWIEGYGQGYARDRGDKNIKGRDRLDAWVASDQEGIDFQRRIKDYPMVTVFECEEIPCCKDK